MDQFQIVAVKRDGKGVNIIHRKGKQILRGIPDGELGNNFDNLPTL